MTRGGTTRAWGPLGTGPSVWEAPMRWVNLDGARVHHGPGHSPMTAQRKPMMMKKPENRAISPRAP